MSLATSIDLRPVPSQGKMWSGMAASGALHVGIALFVAVGLPQLFQPDPPQMSVSVDIVNLDDIAELASLPAERIGPVESAEESKPVAEVDEVARPQQSAAQPAPAVQPTPPQPAEAPALEPAVESAVESTVEPEAAPQPAPAESAPAPSSAVADPEPAPAVEAAPQVSAVAPQPQTPEPTPEPQPVEANQPTPPDTAQPVPQPEGAAADASEEEPLMAGLLPVPSPPRPRDTPAPEAKPADPTPPPSAVRAEEEPEEPVDDLLAGVLRNVDKNLKPSVTEPAQQAVRSNAEVTQSVDLTRKAAALGQMIRGQMQACWRIDPGARSAERLRVSVRVRLRNDGTLAAPPEFQNVGQLTDSAYYRAAAESARRAILECQPFRLPQEDYDLWQDLILNFDPREMF